MTKKRPASEKKPGQLFLNGGSSYYEGLTHLHLIVVSLEWVSASCREIAKLGSFYENNQASQAIVFYKSFWPTCNRSSAYRQAIMPEFKTLLLVESQRIDENK